MYSLMAYFIAFKTIDIVIQGLDESKSAWIISEQYEQIGEAILARLGRRRHVFKWGRGVYGR